MPRAWERLKSLPCPVVRGSDSEVILFHCRPYRLVLLHRYYYHATPLSLDLGHCYGDIVHQRPCFLSDYNSRTTPYCCQTSTNIHTIYQYLYTIPTMASKFVENLEEVPITHPHLNVSLDDILAEEGRKRSASQSSDSSNSNGRSGSESAQSPTSPQHESPLGSIKRRAFTLGSKKIRRPS